MMLPTDMALLSDDKFAPFVKKYAADEQLFFKDFAAAFNKVWIDCCCCCCCVCVCVCVCGVECCTCSLHGYSCKSWA